MTRMSLQRRCEFGGLHASPTGAPCPASPRCSWTRSAWCLWALYCFSAPNQAACCQLCSSAASLAPGAAFSLQHSALLLWHLPLVLRSAEFVVSVPQDLRGEGFKEWCLSFLGNVMGECTGEFGSDTPHGAHRGWTHGREHGVAQGNAVAAFVAWVCRQGLPAL